MFRFFFLLAALFSFNVFAIAPHPDDLFHRLKLDDAFLNSPVCSIKRKGVSLTCDFFTAKNDPAIQSGKITFLNKTHNEKGDHGNIVAEVVSRFLPKGKTYLKESADFQSSIKDDLKNIQSISGHPVLTVNYSIDGGISDEGEVDYEEEAKALCKVMSPILRHKILVLAAGNDSDSLGGEEHLGAFLFAKILSRLSPQERKNLVLVGSTRRDGNREILDTRYSNVAGKYKDQFILAPAGFSSYSPETKRYNPQFGTSFAAPVITGLLTRALLANPHLKPEEAIQILFQTANKRGLVSTGDATLNGSLYGHGIVDAPLFFKAAHAFNSARAQGKAPQTSLARLLKAPQRNVFKDFRKNLRDKLDVMNLLDDYEDKDDSEFKSYKGHIQRIAKQGQVNLGKFPKSMLNLDDFVSCSEIFKTRKLSDRKFTRFALSKFPLSSTSKEMGGSLLSAALIAQRNDLADHLLNNGFNIHLRGKNSLGDAGLLPIHGATYIGNEVYVKKLIQKGSSVTDRINPAFFPYFVDTPLITIVGALEYPNIPQRLKILDMLYHQGANFSQTIVDKTLAELTEELLGADSLITQRVKYYAQNSGVIKRKPIQIEAPAQITPGKKPSLQKGSSKLTRKQTVKEDRKKARLERKKAAQKAKLERKAKQKTKIKGNRAKKKA